MQLQLLPHVHVAPAAHCRVHVPLVHVEVHVDPAAHVVVQSQLEHDTWQVPPAGQVVLQSPLSHVTVHGPPPHVSSQSPLLQSSAHEPVAGQVMLQSPLLHAQSPVVHAQVPTEQAVGSPVEVDAEPHATTSAAAATRKEAKAFMRGILPSGHAPDDTAASRTVVATVRVDRARLEVRERSREVGEDSRGA